MPASPYLCDECGEEFSVELAAYDHAVTNDHTVRYWGDGKQT